MTRESNVNDVGKKNKTTSLKHVTLYARDPFGEWMILDWEATTQHKYQCNTVMFHFVGYLLEHSSLL